MDIKVTIPVVVITLLLLHHVVTLPKDTNVQRKRAKWIAFSGYLSLSAAVFVDMYVFDFFEFNYSMLAIALIPACIYSLLFERKRNA